MRAGGITRKVLLLALLPGMVIALTLSAYFTHLQLDALDRALHEEGQIIATQLAPASEYGVIAGNHEMLSRLASAILQREDVAWVGIRDSSTRLRVQVGKLRSSWDTMHPVPNAKGVCREQPGALVFCAPIYQTRLQVSDFPDERTVSATNELLGWVFVEMSTAANARRRVEVVISSLMIAGLLLFVTSLFASYVGYQLSHPLVAVTRTVQQVARGNLGVQVEEGGGGELFALAHGINAMISALRVSHEEMQRRIDEATAQLRETLLELEQQNRALDEQRRYAQAASQAKGQFLANMSHEIRTPLSGIIGMLALLEQTELQPSQRAYVTNLSLAATALHTLLNDILDLSRIEAGKLQLIEQVFTPRQILDEVVLMLATSAHEKGVDLICHTAAAMPERIRGDSVRLRQVLINLVANAIKFTEQGAVVVRVFVLPAAQPPDDRLWVRFEVEDSGIGIPQDRQQNIFESFTQIDSSNTRRYGGSGLGTTIARELVQLMGGRIGLYSVVGEGSLFWFELPWQVEDTSPGEVDNTALRGIPLIIVQQDDEGRRALHELAQRLGLLVQVTDDASAVPGMLAGSSEVPLVLLVERGRAASWLNPARTLRQQPATARALLCHVTFFNGDTDVDLFDGHMNKPVTLESLRDGLLALLRASGKTPERAGALAPVMTSPAAPRRVLVAEDNHINALVIRSFLEQAGYRVVLVENGADAVTVLARNEFDAVLMDMRMPQVDGLEATRRWRAQEPAGRHTPIIALTANATVDDREQCLAAGMDDFLSKPVDRGQLLELLAKFG